MIRGVLGRIVWEEEEICVGTRDTECGLFRSVKVFTISKYGNFRIEEKYVQQELTQLRRMQQ